LRRIHIAGQISGYRSIRIKSRFVQAKQWVRSPSEIGNALEVWVSDLDGRQEVSKRDGP
jgi:hypothetical protein